MCAAFSDFSDWVFACRVRAQVEVAMSKSLALAVELEVQLQLKAEFGKEQCLHTREDPMEYPPKGYGDVAAVGLTMVHPDVPREGAP